MNTNKKSRYPVYIDGAKVCEAERISYTIEAPVEYKGSSLPGPTVVEQDPPEYTIEAELPSDDIYAPIETNSHVEVAIPPAEYGGSGWRVIEVWMIHQYEITNGTFSLSAYQGDIVDGVSYLGDDTERVVAGDKLVDVGAGDTLRIDTKHDSDDERTVSNDESDEAQFEANVHDI